MERNRLYEYYRSLPNKQVLLPHEINPETLSNDELKEAARQIEAGQLIIIPQTQEQQFQALNTLLDQSIPKLPENLRPEPEESTDYPSAEHLEALKRVFERSDATISFYNARPPYTRSYSPAHEYFSHHEPPYSEATLNIFKNARHLASSNGSDRLGSVHLLAALLENPEIANIVDQLKIDLAKIEQITNILINHHTQDHPITDLTLTTGAQAILFGADRRRYFALAPQVEPIHMPIHMFEEAIDDNRNSDYRSKSSMIFNLFGGSWLKFKQLTDPHLPDPK